MNAITLTQVSKSYGAVQEINALDLTIGAGQAVEIHGGTALLRTLDADVTLQALHPESRGPQPDRGGTVRRGTGLALTPVSANSAWGRRWSSFRPAIWAGGRTPGSG
ncbi:MAG: hypothetical protein JWL58_3291 [Streptosporangiaceae bacterium]|nr:hypothetical protein [Streptosporangiaceae bacterium]